MALVQPGANLAGAKKIFEKWIYLPGYRDALLNNSILSVGMYLDGDILVINATSGHRRPEGVQRRLRRAIRRATTPA
jgi:hypothetical protein